MSRFASRFWILAGLLVSMNLSAILIFAIAVHRRPTDPDTVKVLCTLPSKDFEKAEELAVVFDRDVIDPAKIGQPLAESPFNIQPHIPGHWQWRTRRTLLFIPAKPLQAGRQYTIQATANAEIQLGRRLLGDAAFSFKTTPLMLEKCILSQATPNQAVARLSFNQPVDPGDLLKHITIRSQHNLRNIEPQCNEHTPAKTIELYLTLQENDRQLKLTIDPKLTGAGAELPLSGQHEAQLVIPTDLRLSYQGVYEDEQPVRVYFSFTRELLQAPDSVQCAPAVANLKIEQRRHRLYLTGDFQHGKRYQITIPAGLRAKDGNMTTGKIVRSVNIDMKSPHIDLPQSNGILSPHGNMLLDIKTTNTPELTIRTWRIHPNNLVSHLHGDYINQIARTLGEKKCKLQVTPNREQTLAVDLRKLVDQPHGLFQIEIRGKRYWQRERAIINVTDLAITAKQHKLGYSVWVTNLNTGQPAPGATIRALTANNQQLAEAVTDDQGWADLLILSHNQPDGPAWVLTAEKDQQIAYLQTDAPRWTHGATDLAGNRRPEHYEVMTYTDRGVCRPGQTIQLTGICRDETGLIPNAFPLQVKIRRPDGKHIATVPMTATQPEQGIYQLRYPTPDAGQTGRYTLTVHIPGQNQVLGKASVLVEHFLPLRMKVQAEAESNIVGPGQKPVVHLQAEYLAGQPAENLPVNCDAVLKSVRFTSDSYPDYQFDIDTTHRLYLHAEEQLATGGKVTVKPQIKANDNPPVRYAGRINLTVTDHGGRSVTDQVPIVIDPLGRHLGLRLRHQDRYVPIRRQTPVDWITLDHQARPVNTEKITVQLEHLQYQWSRIRRNGSYVWQSQTRTEPVMQQTITTGPNHKGRFNIRCPKWGRYRLTVRDATNRHIQSQLNFYATDPYNSNTTPDLEDPQSVELQINTTDVQPGDTVNLRIQSPFAGQMLLSLETDQIIHHQTIELTEKISTIPFEIPAGLRGSAYLLATVVRPVNTRSDQWLPNRAYGILRIDPTTRQAAMPIRMNLPEECQPNQPMQITVQTETPNPDGPKPVVHLWAVDEGILLTTGYRTPDPLQYFHGRRTLQVASNDVFSRLLSDHRRAETIKRIGAGADESTDQAQAMRRNPVTIDRKAPAVIFQDAVQVDPTGTATFNLTSPDMQGSLRIMAVVVHGDRYQSESANIIVRSPVTIELTAPRTTAAGDQYNMVIQLINHLPTRVLADVKLTVDGAADLQQPINGTAIHLPANGRRMVSVPMVGRGMGQVTAQVDATMRYPESRTDSPILCSSTADARWTCRPVTPLTLRTRTYTLAPNQPVQLKVDRQFIPGFLNRRLYITTNPQIQMRPAIDALVDYPHGCVEQTSSRMLALLAAEHLYTENEKQSIGIDRLINAGITHLNQMRTRRGGLAYWPGNSKPQLWGTIHATDALIRAKEAGYHVDNQWCQELADYLTKACQRHDQAMSDNLRAELCDLLARMDQPNRSWMQTLTDRLQSLDTGARAHLASAWLACGRRDMAQTVLTEDTLGALVPRPAQGGRLTGPIVQQAKLLNVMLQYDPKHPWIPMLVQRLNHARENGRWYNTLTNGQCLLALSRYQKMNPPGTDQITKLQCGTKTFKLTGQQVLQYTPEQPDQTIKLQLDSPNPCHVIEITEGQTTDGNVNDDDRNIKIRRQWLDPHGKPVQINQLKIGDLVFVKLTLTVMPTIGQVENLAIVDRIPGAMEIENPRLNAGAGGALAGDTANRVEFLDDRVIIFPHPINRGKSRHYIYPLRVVHAGQFTIPQVEASSMYDPSIASVHGRGQIHIQPLPASAASTDDRPWFETD